MRAEDQHSVDNDGIQGDKAAGFRQARPPAGAHHTGGDDVKQLAM